MSDFLRKNKLPTLERLNEVFNYDPLTGKMTYKIDRNNRIKAGDSAGSTDKKTGCCWLRLDGISLLAHRIMWYMHYGSPAQVKISHINGNLSDNRIDNLTINGIKRDTNQARTDQLLERLKEKYGDMYDYSLSVAVGGGEKVTVICPVHGEFYKGRKELLLPNAKGCQKCEWENRRLAQIGKKINQVGVMDVDSFLEKAEAKFGDRFEYDVSNYQRGKWPKIRITCPDHGDFLQTPNYFLQKAYGCHKCYNIEDYSNVESILEKCRTKHNDFYFYPNCNFELIRTSQSNITFICPVHGQLEKNVRGHLKNGYGCNPCERERKILDGYAAGCYNESYFERSPESGKKLGTLYYLNIQEEKYFKIGITKTHDIKSRLITLRSDSKGHSEPHIVECEIHSTLLEVFLIEQFLLKFNRNIRIFRFWTTELFSADISDQLRFFEEGLAIHGNLSNFDWENEFYAHFRVN